MEHAYVDIKTKGDLSSFKWFENDLKNWKNASDEEKQDSVLCQVSRALYS